jgi:TonB-linked SusC/RagA family outer membrane protein
MKKSRFKQETGGMKSQFQLILIFMKVTVFLTLFCVFQAFAGNSYSQNTRLSINLSKVSVKNALESIEKESEFYFLYNSKLINVDRTVSLSTNHKLIKDVLHELFDGTDVKYTIIDRQIVLTPVKFSNEEINTIQQQKKNIVTGKVLDKNGQTMVGVTVLIKGTQKAVLTDMNGNFNIELADKKATLVFSYIGFLTQEYKLAGENTVNIVLVTSIKSLDEVIVVGYSTQKKANLTGSVSGVSSTQLQDRPIMGLANALEGTMSGVTIVSNNGQPGKDAGTINIRGIGTLNNTNPMIVIDGVISTPTDMNAINADDVENISVLKDAASASIYGSRAANGVIVITTKKGKKGSVQVTYSNYFGKQTATALPDDLPSWQAATLYNQALANEGKNAQYTAAQIQKFKDGSDPYNYPNTNWQKLFYNGSGFQQNHYLSLNGGNDKTQYLFSLGYFDQDGLTKKTNTQRYTTRLNLNSIVNNRLTIFANISYTYQPLEEPQSSYPGVSSFSQVIRQVNRISPMVPYKYANGNYGYIADGSPMAWINSPSFNDQKAYNLQGITGIDWEILTGLHFKPSLAYKLIQDQNEKFIADIQYYNSAGTPTLYQGPNSATDFYDNSTVVTPQAILEYGLKLGDHNFKALAGYSQEYTKYTSMQGYRQGFLNNSLSALDLGSQTGQTSNGTSYERALRSYFGRVNYDYKSKYLLEANLRDDASSIFSPSNRWGLFPSASGAWRVSEEGFFAPIKSVVSNLKLRGSWGQLGNQNISSNYPYIPTISSGQNYVFGGVDASGIAPVNGTNANIMWETTTETDFGLDANFFKDKFTLSADYFIKKTDDILFNLPVSATYGLTAPSQNTASVQNKGFEFSLGYHDTKGDFNYSITANASFITNKVTSLGAGGSPQISGSTITNIGLPINSFWGYQTEGIFQTQAQVNAHATQNMGGPTGPGDLIYKDQNGDGKIDGKDKVYLGSHFPKATFGLNLTLGWKQFDLTGFFQGAAGVKNIISGAMLGQNGNNSTKPTSALLDSWSAQNTTASFPRLWVSYQQNDPGRNPSSFWIRDASYVRLKNLQLGYTLPLKWSNALHIQKLRIYYSGQNIVTFTKFYKWVDPEAPLGESGYDYPQVKINTIGLNVTF